MDNSMIVELGIAPAHAITPAQILEARRRFDDLYATKWSAELRAKLAASAAAERLTVPVDQDPDDIPWR